MKTHSWSDIKAVRAEFRSRAIYPIDKDGNRIGEDLSSNTLDVQLANDYRTNFIAWTAALAMCAPFECQTNPNYLPDNLFERMMNL